MDRLLLGWCDRISQAEIQQEILIISWSTGIVPEKCLVPALASLMKDSYVSDYLEQDCRVLDKIQVENKPTLFDLECLSDLLSDKLDIPYKYRYILWLMADKGVGHVATLVSTDLGDVSRHRQKILHLLLQSWKD